MRGASYEVVSAVTTSPRTWQCRVRVDGRDYLWKLSRQQEGLLDVGTVVQVLPLSSRSQTHPSPPPSPPLNPPSPLTPHPNT